MDGEREPPWTALGVSPGCPEGRVAQGLRRRRNSSGTALYNSWPFDPGIGSLTWRIWKLGLASNPEAGGAPLPPNNVEAGAPSMAFIFSTPAADPAVLTGNGTTELDYALGFSFDTDAAKIFATDARSMSNRRGL